MTVRFKRNRSHRDNRRPQLPLRQLAFAAMCFMSSLMFAGIALAAVSAPTGSIGDQTATLSNESLFAGSTVAGMASYLAATLAFLGGAWALWQSRQPQNRESGHVAKGLAGLVLCGVFATMGVWVNKAAVSTSGGAATVNTTGGMVQFGTGTTAN